MLLDYQRLTSEDEKLEGDIKALASAIDYS